MGFHARKSKPRRDAVPRTSQTVRWNCPIVFRLGHGLTRSGPEPDSGAATSAPLRYPYDGRRQQGRVSA
jgi:hypothetical protein